MLGLRGIFYLRNQKQPSSSVILQTITFRGNISTNKTTAVLYWENGGKFFYTIYSIKLLPWEGLHNPLCHHREKTLATLRFAEVFWRRFGTESDDSLCHHRLGNFHEASDVGAFDVVHVAVRLGAVLHAVLVDVLHDPEQLRIHLLGTP